MLVGQCGIALSVEHVESHRKSNSGVLLVLLVRQCRVVSLEFLE